LKTEPPFRQDTGAGTAEIRAFFLGRSHHCALLGGGFVNVAKYYKALEIKKRFTQ